MSLRAYRDKRHFKQTPEPQGKLEKSGGPLRFVVQKHHASHLHYDFRLELHGTLKSWAVPKGPSLNPEDKRLAMMVEDHPLEYRTFEGIIPAGNYGAGAVMVWDQGTYSALDALNPKDRDKSLDEGLRKGRLSIVLKGKKLKGAFSLVKLHGKEANAWLLIKKDDEFADTATSVEKKNRSVISRRTLEQIAAEAEKNGEIWLSKRRAEKLELSGAPPGKMSRRIKPMLATLVEEPFDHDDWIFEVKWDGYRAIAEVDSKRVRFYSRNHQSFEHKFASVVRVLERLGHEAVLDGEVVALDKAGKSKFQLLQNFQRTGEGNLVYYVFDILYLDGHDLRRLPLSRRKELLSEVISDIPNIKVSEHIEKQGRAFFEAVERQGLEGVIAKNATSPYREGIRSPNWLKIKTHKRQEAIVCGFTEPRGSRKGLGALILGVYEGEELTYIGHTGGGFAAKDLKDARDRLEPFLQSKSPFRQRPRPNAPVHWLRPEAVCEVSFQDWTEDGRMRHPIFIGWREDKPARSVRKENPRNIDTGVKPPEEKPAEKTRSAMTSAAKSLNDRRLIRPSG